MRLRTILVLVFAVSAIALTLLGTLAVAQFITGRTQVRAEARMADLAGQLRQLIDANIDERLGDMAVLTGVARSTAATPEARRTWIEALRATYPAYAWIGFADRDGRVTAATGGLLEGASVAARPWFQRGLDGPAVADVHEAVLLARALPALPRDEPKRFVDVAAPLRDTSGAVVGVVGGHLSLQWMREMSRAAIAPALARDPSVEVLNLAGEGTVVLGPGDLRGERLGVDLPTLAALTAGAEEATARGPWPDGRDYFTAASRARASAERPRLPWTVVVRQPVAVALAPSRDFIEMLALGGATFALLSALLGWWAAERLADPLRALAAAASRVEGGPVGTRLPTPRGYAEIGELTGALSALLARLGERDRALAAMNADLERRVAERTAERAEARDRAQAADQAKGDFLAAMSHEIRTPLNGVIGYADLLRDEPDLARPARLHAERIRTSGAALLTVVNDVLDFAKVEAGQVEIAPRPFALGALIDGALAIVRGPAEARGLAVNIALGPDLPDWVTGDRDRLTQILLNLLGNACKFTRAGWVGLAIETRGIESGRVRLRLAVTDTGVGVPADRRDRLFRHFSQADGSIHRPRTPCSTCSTPMTARRLASGWSAPPRGWTTTSTGCA